MRSLYIRNYYVCMCLHMHMYATYHLAQHLPCGCSPDTDTYFGHTTLEQAKPSKNHSQKLTVWINP